jgi:hypothetical protein
LATCLIDQSPTRQRDTASALNTALNGLRFRPMAEHSYRTGLRLLVSMETGRIIRGLVTIVHEVRPPRGLGIILVPG